MSIQSSLLSTILTIALSATAAAQTGSPRVDTAEPDSGKAGAVIAINGENLEKANVTQLFLTDGKNDLKVEIVEQVSKSIKFKIPAEAKAGRFSIMILTGGKDPKLLEQPVKITVE